ncbi:MAG: response regulator [Bacteroidetes bacterium]|nr:response regulator [Bacteroidota bacterium]MCW5894465.1 response regulator [Bacteroidota bacterium]
MHLPEASTTVFVDNPYHKAKIEHYLERAEDLFRMARYKQAQKMLGSVFALDPEDRSGQALQKAISAALSNLHSVSSHFSNHSNGHAKQFRRGEVVLVVDQDERVLISLAGTLHKYGFGAIGAGGLEEAIDALSTFKPSLIISEVNFESGSIGYDLYLWIRHNEELGATPFLYLATRVTREMLIAGRRMGVDEFIVKPLDEEVVMASILHCLSRRKKKVA